MRARLGIWLKGMVHLKLCARASVLSFLHAPQPRTGLLKLDSDGALRRVQKDRVAHRRKIFYNISATGSGPVGFKILRLRVILRVYIAGDVQGIQGVRFKRLIMDESASDRHPHPPKEEGFKRLVFCSGKVRTQVDTQYMTAFLSLQASAKQCDLQ